MGLMDKVKAQATVLADKAQTGVQQGQTKLQELQSAKQVDHLLRELGATVFLSERGRARPDDEARVAAIMGELDTLEAAGTPVTITSDPAGAPPAGGVPGPGAPTPRPTETAQGPVADQAPSGGQAAPGGGGFIPQSGGNLPGQ